MPQKTPYWRKIASLIEENLQLGHPEEWEQKQINAFLVLLEEVVQKKCQEDPATAERCGVPYIRGKYLIDRWRTIDSSTFRRIFKYGTSVGQTQTKQQFAIFLGYQSYEHFLIGNNPKQENHQVEEENTAEDSLSLSDQINEFETIVLNENFKWLIFWLFGCGLVHNIFGIIKVMGNLPYPDWVYIFWVPPILISLLTYSVGQWGIKRLRKDKLPYLMIVWWATIALMIVVNQYIPRWFSCIQTGGLMVIGIMGQLSLSTKLFYAINPEDTTVNQQKNYISIYNYSMDVVISMYFLGLFFGFLFIATGWIIPDENIKPYSNNLVLFRIYCTTEMIISFMLISIGYKKLVMNPLLNVAETTKIL